MKAHKVFISYSYEDSEWVRAFAEALRQQKMDVWLDQWSVAPGESLRSAIEVGLRESDAIIAVVSRSNARNPNVFFELGVALGMGKRLIPIISADLETALIPFDLRVRRYLTMGRPDDIAKKVVSAVTSNQDENTEGKA